MRRRFRPQKHWENHCPKTGKRQYRDQLDVLLDNTMNVRKISAYKCQHCAYWHGTSQKVKAQ